MKKRLLALMLAFIVSSSITAFADKPIKINVNGVSVETDTDPIIIEGTTMVPIRTISDALSADVDWNDKKKTATIVLGKKSIVIKINSKSMTVSKKRFPLAQPAQIVNERTMIPIRAISEAFGSDVAWDDKTKTVVITSEKIPTPIDPDAKPTKEQSDMYNKIYIGFKSELYDIETDYSTPLKRIKSTKEDKLDSLEDDMGFTVMDPEFAMYMREDLERIYDFMTMLMEDEKDYRLRQTYKKFGVPQRLAFSSKVTYEEFMEAVDTKYINPTTSENARLVEQINDIRRRPLPTSSELKQLTEDYKAAKKSLDRSFSDEETHFSKQKKEVEKMVSSYSDDPNSGNAQTFASKHYTEIAEIFKTEKVAREEGLKNVFHQSED